VFLPSLLLTSTHIHAFPFCAFQLGNQIIDSLKEENAWMVALLKAFNSGNQAECERVVTEHATKFNAQVSWFHLHPSCLLYLIFISFLLLQPALVNNRPLLNQKLAILSLMELVFKRASEDRTIDFTTIAEATKLPLHEVCYRNFCSPTIYLVISLASSFLTFQFLF
jgi:26S proteasome regulatory subunit N9